MVYVIFVGYSVITLVSLYLFFVGGKNPTAAQMKQVMKTMCKTTTSIRRFVHQLTSLWRPLYLCFMLPLCYVILWVKHLCHSVIMIYLMLCTFLSLVCVVVICNLSCICETFPGAYICCTVLFIETGCDTIDPSVVLDMFVLVCMQVLDWWHGKVGRPWAKVGWPCLLGLGLPGSFDGRPTLGGSRPALVMVSWP